MTFIVTPQNDQQDLQSPKRPPYHTMCALCSEDPRFCGDII